MVVRLPSLLLAVVLLAGALTVAPGLPAYADPGAQQTVAPGPVNTRLPEARGDARFTRTLRAFPGRWTPDRAETRYRWLRDGERIAGARDRAYTLQAADVGSRIQVEVTVTGQGLGWTSALSEPTRRVRHRVDVRRVVTYQVETRGRLRASVAVFRALAQETFEDPRGWRNGGVEFRRVPRGGDFSLVLAEASWLPRFSSGCSSTWSCRVGRYVVINQTRWLHASPAWNRARRSLRDYRHMVVNHETGHWLGRGHRGCPARGRLAPVMMQQSKGTGGCRFNPWPTPPEL